MLVEFTFRSMSFLRNSKKKVGGDLKKKIHSHTVACIDFLKGGGEKKKKCYSRGD